MKPLFCFALITLALVTGCKKETNAPSGPNQQVLDYGECGGFSGPQWTICFKSAHEYRCPCMADCVWAGSCNVTLGITGNGTDTLLALCAFPYPGSAPDSAVINGHTIRLDSLEANMCEHYADYSFYKVHVSVD